MINFRFHVDYIFHLSLMRSIETRKSVLFRVLLELSVLTDGVHYGMAVL